MTVAMRRKSLKSNATAPVWRRRHGMSGLRSGALRGFGTAGFDPKRTFDGLGTTGCPGANSPAVLHPGKPQRAHDRPAVAEDAVAMRPRNAPPGGCTRAGR